MINGLTLLMNSNFSHPMNLGNDKEFSILETAEKIINLTNSKSKIVFKEFPENDPLKRKPDLSLAKEKIKYNSKVTFSSGLEKTIVYFEEKLKVNNG